jgi:hypothetical protein
MRKLLIIAAILMIPALALAEDIIVTDFEDGSLGPLDGQSMGGGMWWTPWWHGSNEASVIMDPTGAGEGQVIGIHTSLLGDTTGVVADNPLGGNYREDGYTIIELSYYLYGNPYELDWTNCSAMEWGPGQNDYFMDTTDTIEVWTGGDQWDPWAANLTTQTIAPLPIDRWFDVKLVKNNIDQTYDYYVDGVLLGSNLPTNWYEDNYVQIKFYLLDAFLPPGDYYELIDHLYWTWQVPEPSVLALGGLGLLVLLRRRKK